MWTPAGTSARAATPDDLQLVVELLGACELHDDGAVEIEAGDLRSEWRQPGFDLSRLSMAVFAGEHLVGFAHVVGDRATAGVHPRHRGRGVGTALLTFTGDAARAGGSTRVGQTVSDQRFDAPPLFRAHGYGPGRRAWIFDIAVSAAPEPTPPDGYVLRALAPADWPAVHALIETAFNEWPDREPLSFDEWRVFEVEHERFVAEASPVIVHDGAIVGAAINLDYELEGWVDQLAVAREHRGRGLARALLLASFSRHRARGRATVGVSTDTRAGARGLYERVGMRVRRSYTYWSRSLT